MKIVCICGHFGNGTNMNDGQTVKTRVLGNELKRQLGASEVHCIDTHGRMKQILMFPRLVYALAVCRNVIILPAQNGLPLMTKWLSIWNRMFNRKLHYSVIGGWLASFLDSHQKTKEHLKSFHKIYAETSTMKRALVAHGLDNVQVIANCKQLPVISTDNLQANYGNPLRLVTFSRVMKQKGIEDLIRIVRDVNTKLQTTAFQLDIYGPIDPEEHDWWDGQMELISQTDYIQYKGSAPADKSVEILNNYFALMFPTRFFTEGIPGTILDAYAAGVPVISSRWESFADLIDEGSTGLGFEFENWNELRSILVRIYNEPHIITDMKKACIKKAESFLPENVISAIVSELK